MAVTITGGTLRFIQRIKTGDYEHKEATAELNFSVPEDAEFPPEDYSGIADRAVAQVERMLHLTAKANPGRPKMPSPFKKAAPAEATVNQEAAASDTTEAPVEDVTEAALPDITDAELHNKVAERADQFAQAQIATGPKAIKKLIFKLAVPPGEGVKPVLSMVPQSKRREFLQRLKDLTGTEAE